MGFLFGKVTEQMIEDFNAELIPYQIDSKEFGFLTAITSMPEATQQQLGEVLHIDRTTTVKKVDHLESLGYLIRVKNTNERMIIMTNLEYLENLMETTISPMDFLAASKAQPNVFVVVDVRNAPSHLKKVKIAGAIEIPEMDIKI